MQIESVIKQLSKFVIVWQSLQNKLSWKHYDYNNTKVLIS